MLHNQCAPKKIRRAPNQCILGSHHALVLIWNSSALKYLHYKIVIIYEETLGFTFKFKSTPARTEVAHGNAT